MVDSLTHGVIEYFLVLLHCSGLTCLLPQRRRTGLVAKKVTQWILSRVGPPGVTPIYGLYGDVPLERVWFSLPLCRASLS